MMRPSSKIFESSNIQSSNEMIEVFLIFYAVFKSEACKHANLGKANMHKVHNNDRNLQKRDHLTSHFSTESFGKKCLCEVVISGNLVQLRFTIAAETAGERF